jgi:hypothetical protein
MIHQRPPGAATPRLLAGSGAILALGLVLSAGCVAPDAASCAGATSCGQCATAGSGCGWCGDTGTCAHGSSLGPASGQCSQWAFSDCTSVGSGSGSGSGSSSGSSSGLASGSGSGGSVCGDGWTAATSCASCVVPGCSFWCDDGAGIGSCYPESDINLVCTSSSSTSITSLAGCSSVAQCAAGGSPCFSDSDCCSQLCATSDGSGGLLCTP